LIGRFVVLNLPKFASLQGLHSASAGTGLFRPLVASFENCGGLNWIVFTLELSGVRRRFIIKTSSNPAVRTRKATRLCHGTVAVSTRPNHLKNDLPKKQSASALKPNCFHLAQLGMR
jgi:hypothetical protein